MKDEEDLYCVDVHTPYQVGGDDRDHDHKSVVSSDRRLVIAALVVTGIVMVMELAGGREIISNLKEVLKENYQVAHTTFQMECVPDHSGG